MVRFEWENKYYIGNLVAVHRNGIHIAYVIKGMCNGVCVYQMDHWTIILLHYMYSSQLSKIVKYEGFL